MMMIFCFPDVSLCVCVTRGSSTLLAGRTDQAGETNCRELEAMHESPAHWARPAILGGALSCMISGLTLYGELYEEVHLHLPSPGALVQRKQGSLIQ
jgi:hypothetical protein